MKRTLYQFLLVLLLLTACNDPKPVTDALARAEALMNEYPDSAWAVLNTLSPDEMGQNRTRAHYALLYTQAQDKTYRDETNDSLISVAVDYYRDTDDVRRKFLSYYYKGRVYTNAKDYLNATSCYMEAEQLADAVGDDYLSGLLYAELGRIYDIYYDYPKSLEAYQKAASCYERAGKIRHRNYMWLNQGNVFRNMNEYGESESLLLQALASGKANADSAMIRLSMGTMVMQYIERKEMEKADSLLGEFKPFINGTFGSSSFVVRLAQMYLSVGNFDKAEHYLSEGWRRVTNQTDSVSLYVVSAELHSLKGKGEMAYRELLKAVVLQNEDTQQALQQPVLTVQRDYLSEKLAFEVYQVQVEKRLKGLYVLVSVLALVIITFVFVWIFKKYKKKSQQAISRLKSAKKLVEKEKEEIETEKDRIALALQQLDEDKKSADETISKLKEEISQKEKNSNTEISGLLKKLEEKEQAMTGLQQKLGQDENVIGELKEKLVQKEGSRQKMEALIRQLEEESQSNAASIIVLRNDLKCQEEKYQRSMEEAERAQSTLRDEVCRKTTFVSMLFKNWFEVMGMWAFYCEGKTEKGTKKMHKEATLMKEKYMIGNKAFRELEKLVNTYHNDAMLHFRKEVVSLDELDYRRTCYFFAGFPIPTIAWLMDENVKNVYQRRLRLRKMIDSSSFAHKKLYILLLSN